MTGYCLSEKEIVCRLARIQAEVEGLGLDRLVCFAASDARGERAAYHRQHDLLCLAKALRDLLAAVRGTGAAAC